MDMLRCRGIAFLLVILLCVFSCAAGAEEAGEKPEVALMATSTVEAGEESEAAQTATIAAETGEEPEAAPTATNVAESADEPEAAPTATNAAETGEEPEAAPTATDAVEAGGTSEPTPTQTVAPTPDAEARIAVAVTGITLDRDALSLWADEQALLTAEVAPADAEDRAVIWRSADENVLTVTDGLITAVGPGQADVVAETSDGGHTASCNVIVRRAVAEILPAETKLSMGVGEKRALSCGYAPGDATPVLRYSTSDKRVAKVNASGVVTAKGTGRTTITIQDANGATARVTVRVRKAPKSVSLSAARKVIGVGETLALEVGFSKGYGGGYELSSGDESVAMIDGDAVVALSPGTSKIAVTTYNGKKKKGTLTVCPAPEGVCLDRTELTLGVGDGAVLTATLSAGSAGACAFTSADEAVAKVDASAGKVKAVDVGTTEVTVRTYNGCEAVCRVTVLPAPDAVSLSLPEGVKSVGVGEKLRLAAALSPEGSAAGVTYKSSNTRYVTVSKTGVVTGKRAGTAVITIKTHNGKKAKLTVKVKKAPGSVSLTLDRTLLGVGEAAQYRAKLPSGCAGQITVISDDETVARVEDGRIVAVAPGTAVITATAYNGKSRSKTIEVAPAPEGISVSPDEAVIGVGDKITLVATLTEGSAGAYAFASCDPSVATVNPATGAVKAVAEGETTVSVTAYNGVTASAQIKVVAVSEALVLLAPDGDALAMEKGDAFQIVPDMGGKTHYGVTYKSSKSSVASVSASGLVTARASGKCTITATAYNGVSVKIPVTVTIWVDLLDSDYAAHAMGAVDGTVNTNSLEAFLTNYALGCRVFECDLSRTSDGALVLWHSWGGNQINAETPLGYVPTLAEFKEMKIDGKYTTLTYRDIIKLMKEYPDAQFLIDSKARTAAEATETYGQMCGIAEEEDGLDTLDRTIAYVYSKATYRAIDAIHHFDKYVYATYLLEKSAPSTKRFQKIADFCADNGIDVIAMKNSWWSTKYLPVMKKYDVAMEIHTVNSASRAKKLLGSGVSWICTDKLIQMDR